VSRLSQTLPPTFPLIAVLVIYVPRGRCSDHLCRHWSFGIVLMTDAPAFHHFGRPILAIAFLAPYCVCLLVLGRWCKTTLTVLPTLTGHCATLQNIRRYHRTTGLIPTARICSALCIFDVHSSPNLSSNRHGRKDNRLRTSESNAPHFKLKLEYGVLLEHRRVEMA
jgi:hypothetical protein